MFLPSTSIDEGDQSDSKTIPDQLDSDMKTYQSDKDTIPYNKLGEGENPQTEELRVSPRQKGKSWLSTEMSKAVVMPMGYKGHWKKGYFQNLLCLTYIEGEMYYT